MKPPLYIGLDCVLLVIAFLLWLFLWKKLSTIEKISSVATFMVLVILSTACQYFNFIRFHAWTVNDAVTCLLPMRFLGSPIEEYLFWWASALIMIALYLWPLKLLSHTNHSG